MEVQHASSPFPDNAAKLQGTHFVISTFMSGAGALRLTPDQAIPHLGVLQGWEGEGGVGGMPLNKERSMRRQVNKNKCSSGCLDSNTGIHGVSKRD